RRRTQARLFPEHFVGHIAHLEGEARLVVLPAADREDLAAHFPYVRSTPLDHVGRRGKAPAECVVLFIGHLAGFTFTPTRWLLAALTCRHRPRGEELPDLIVKQLIVIASQRVARMRAPDNRLREAIQSATPEMVWIASSLYSLAQTLRV